MGMLLGKVDGENMIIMNLFALPGEGTEIRVNAHQEAYEYMSSYILSAKQVNRLENVIGNKNNIYFWIDPTRTISAGKVNIGAFRTYAEGYKAENEMIDYQAIPLDKAQDFGVHYKKYYPLEASFFKSSLDKRLLEHLWNRYWVSTLR
ncbi:unnamed protein product [Rotaria sp. Silwood1]|nr:unnamed protein product [Rotaria sp. Silwood1]